MEGQTENDEGEPYSERKRDIGTDREMRRKIGGRERRQRTKRGMEGQTEMREMDWGQEEGWGTEGGRES